MLSPLNRKYFRLAVSNLKKDTDMDMSANCPLCGDKKHRLHLFEPDNTGGIIKCFNAGCDLEYGASMQQFLTAIGSPYISSFKREHLQQNIDEIKNENSVQDILSKVKAKKEQPSEPIELPLDKLFIRANKSEKAIEYIKTRGFEPHDDWFYSKDTEFEYNNEKVKLVNCVIFPIYENGKYKGFFSRSIDKKEFYIFLLPGTEKLWVKGDLSNGDGVIAEGLFDALSTGFDTCGAMLGADLSKDYVQNLPKSTIFAFDNDKTGINKAIKYSKLGFKIFVWPEMDIKDFNELLLTGKTKQEIKNFIQRNTYTGILAETRLKMKEK